MSPDRLVSYLALSRQGTRGATQLLNNETRERNQTGLIYISSKLVAKSGQPAQQIGPCAPSEYTGPVMSNPYRQKIDFHKGFLRRISDSGVDPFEVASTEISSTEINSAETAQSAPGNPSFLAANEAFNQPLLPLAEFTVPGSSSSDGPDGPEYVNFNTVRRSRKRRRDI